MTPARTPYPDPAQTDDLRGVLLDYLDFYRGVVATKLDGLAADDVAGSVLPSGWTPSGLVHHLVNVERRWLEWGFLGEPIEEPWRDASDVSALTGRFRDEASAPQLQWILLHLVQEYARHLGHLDIARELIDGHTGEDG